MNMSTTSTHVVLGGNGVVGRETIRALLQRGITPASLGRTPPTNAEVRPIIADLLDTEAVDRALTGAEVAYLTAGLPYSARIWARDWPTIMGNCIEAAIAHDTALVYLDNVYAYGPVDGAMSEDTAIHPTSRKGKVRAAALRVLQEGKRRGLVHTVARSADFYGPGATTSAFTTMVLDKIAAGGTPTWFFDAHQPHSMTYTPDIGDALAILGTDPRGLGGVWHIPTAPALTGQDYINIAGGGRYQTMGTAMMRMGALFNTAARETLEMAYQYIASYVFDSTAFETTFGMAPTPYEVAIPAALSPGGVVAQDHRDHHRSKE